jgi:hypothetical protein
VPILTMASVSEDRDKHVEDESFVYRWVFAIVFAVIVFAIISMIGADGNSAGGY